jgi:hypothetical protein
MVTIPAVSFLIFTDDAPQKSNNSQNSFPVGNAATELGRYSYALLSLEMSLPIAGRIKRK